MAKYTVRVELHSNQYTPDFETLHREMSKEGFSKLIAAEARQNLPSSSWRI